MEITVDGKDVKKAKNREVKVDEEKAAEEEKLDGLYLITTNMISKPPEFAVRIYKELKFAEQDFRLLKSDFNIRPFFAKKQEHICAVLDFSVYALYALRVLREMLGRKFTAERVLRDLRSYVAVVEDDGRYRVLGKPKVVKELEKMTGIGLTHRFISKKDLKKAFTPKREWLKTDPLNLFPKKS